MVSIRSGYADAKRNIATAKENLESSKLLAPFKGKIANLNYKQYELVSSGRDFLTLINDDTFEVEFFLIESEIADVQIGDVVSVVPFALKTTYKGKVTSINAEVAKNGTILVKAGIKNDGKLLEGMNVKVFIQKDIPNQYVVPKSAVVLRQNQEVLFRVVNNRAFWTYVLTTNENSNSYAVVPHPDKNSAILQLGDSIITSNNLNLAHDTAVKIKSNK
jgi:RND family efflux transporter MFP subunit